MENSSDAVLAWLVYLFGCLLTLICLWRFSRDWTSSWSKMAFRLIPAVLLLVPSRVDIDASALAPALFVAAFEFTMRSEPEAGVLALWRLGYALGALALIAFGFTAWRVYRSR